MIATRPDTDGYAGGDRRAATSADTFAPGAPGAMVTTSPAVGRCPAHGRHGVVGRDAHELCAYRRRAAARKDAYDVRHAGRSRGFPREWQMTDDYEYIPVRLPPDVTRVTASMRLSLEAEFGGWELSRVRLYPDGTRKVLLRRRRPRSGAADDGVGGGDQTELSA